MIASGGALAPLALLTIGGRDIPQLVLDASLLHFPQRRCERPAIALDNESYLAAHPVIGISGCLHCPAANGGTMLTTQ